MEFRATKIPRRLALAPIPVMLSCATRSPAPRVEDAGVALTLEALHGRPGFHPEGFGPARRLEDRSA